MIPLLIVKLVLLGAVWTYGICHYFDKRGTDINMLHISVAFAPWILWLVYFMLFYWG